MKLVKHLLDAKGRNVISIAPGASVFDAIKVMADESIGSLVVLDENAKQAMTQINSGAGADNIQYALNAPVTIDGGDGFDTVVVIGCEAAGKTVRDALEATDCRVIQGMRSEGIMSIQPRFHPPGNLLLELQSVTPLLDPAQSG